MLSDYAAGQFGMSDAPDNCTECGTEWSASERLRTGDSNGIGGWEDWMYCKACDIQVFFPVVHRHEPTTWQQSEPPTPGNTCP